MKSESPERKQAPSTSSDAFLIVNTDLPPKRLRATSLFPLDDVVEFMREDFGPKFPPKIVAGNIRALTRAYEEVQGQ